MARLFICIAFLVVLTGATPQVNYPLNLQFPPVARVGEQFNFQFAYTTFSSDSGNLQYSLIGNPSWLSLDSPSRTLSGTPHASDVGIIKFTITAAGQAGTVANMESKLLVSADDAPRTKGNISAELSTAGKLSGPQTVTLNPSSSFNISFSSDTFGSPKKKLSYFATLADRTPLPAWISFDASSIHFAGSTPPSQSPQSFEILLIACETPDFAASSVSFTMVISKHSLFFDPFSQAINLSKGDEVRITNLKQQLFLDESSIADDELQSITADLPSWLTLDNDTFEIVGKSPSNVMSQNLTVTAKDQSGDTAERTISLVFKSELFSSEIGNLSLTAGESFEHKISQSVIAKDVESVTVDFGSLAEYLHFDPTTLVISGTVPQDLPSQDVECSITAISSDSAQKDTQAFHIEVYEAGHGSQVTPSKAGAADTQQRPDRNKDSIIVGSVIGAVCGAAILLIFTLCLRRRKRNMKDYVDPKVPRSPRKSDISRPMFIPYGWPDLEEDADEDLEKGKNDHDSFVERTPEQPPKLEVDLARDHGDSHSVGESIDDADTRILDIFDESSWGIQNDITPSQHPHDSMKIPTELAKRASQRSDTFRKHKRRTTTVYQDHIQRSSGLPVNRRITGMGHGRHTYSPSRSNTMFSRSSMRRPLSMNSESTTRCTSTCSTAPSAFPQPPAARKHTTMVTTPREERRSIRIVPACMRSSLTDRRTDDERRNSYIRKRASAQSPFFSASTRASSSNYRSPPAFIAEAQSSPRVALSPTTRNTIVRPNDDVVAGKEKEIPQSLRVVKPSGTQAGISKQEFPGSLRTNRTNRPCTAIAANRDRVEKTSGSRTSFGRRASTRQSLRAYDLKATLNDLTGIKIFEDVEMSDSVYSDEEIDIEEAEKRKTVKPGQYTLPPLNLDRVDTARNNKRESAVGKSKTKRNSKRELKRTNERDPTPYYFASSHEHGGKENASSTYTLGHRSSPVRIEVKGKARAVTSPERTKASTARQSKLANEARTSVNRTTNEGSTKERHSRKSIHSRSQSRQSGGISVKKPRDHSRTQSSAFPRFDATIFESIGADNRSSIGNAITTAADAVCLPASNTKASLIMRDLSGNLTFYGGDGDEPTIEELGSSSIGFRTSNGRINSVAQRSRLASLHLSSHHVPQVPPKSSKRETVIPVSTSQHTASVGLFPHGCPGDEKERKRTPLNVVQAENAATPEPDEQQVHSRKTWGSLKGIVGRGSRWVSGGYWDKQGKEDKVFI
ncbi:uncharacterized protein K460DRAFT_326420 [Cucurbitaria berberidis CBS 394.84]|uniref:Dystroglycan-type cadherin-like domain-containing protein n=1 Tax=Cucurbitaria berberidis CBS 394.84 TaxID=1168544 RepID=A0A9P4GP03_9PLEO|nr:uncharacterized protein K460DRAFT_326420 [Cucurbitaria berberidis CBS 394.84]KAF1849988.1 hypothetical protein K460DRAFT_326420 [Cucurbitaria berberidis CBS 394.84]